MKTIRQIAEEIGVTKQAIEKRISREPLHTQTQTHSHTKGNAIYIDEAGEILIKYAFRKIVTIDKIANQNADTNVKFTKFLQEQLKIKDSQIADLTAIIKIQAVNARRKSSKRVVYAKKLPTIKSGAIKKLINRGEPNPAGA